MNALPERMQYVDLSGAGGPEVLVLREGPVPSPGTGELLIRVEAAGLNRADVLQRQGAYPPPAGAPRFPGLEVAGTVAAVGAEVTAFGPGDPVCALLQGGGYAQYAVAPVVQTLPVPRGLSTLEAATLPEAYFTVWSNLYEFGRLVPGETLLVHGGSSGIGVAAIQLARARGSRVLATAGSADKCRFCEELGAESAIDYKLKDFVSRALATTDGRGVDVILDMVGGSYLARNVAALAAEGRLVIIATPGGHEASLDLRALMMKRAVVTGSALRPRSSQFKAHIKAQLLREVWPLLAAARVRPVTDTVFALEQAAQAHAHMESGRHRGKIVLRVAHA